MVMLVLYSINTLVSEIAQTPTRLRTTLRQVSAAIFCTGGLDVIRNETCLFCRPSSYVCLRGELRQLEEPKTTNQTTDGFTVRG